MSNEIAILQLMMTPHLGSKTLSRVLSRLSEQQQALQDLIALPANKLAQSFGIAPAVAAAIAGTYAQAEELSRELELHDIQVVALGMAEYPERLRRNLEADAPPVLFVRGNLSLLSRHAVAFAGSRHASELGVKATLHAANALSLQDVNVISGYANGVDLAAHKGALENDGPTTLVLAEGILQFKVKREIAPYLDGGNHVIISEFPPTLRWIARNAMQRNRTIIGLSEALVIIESGEEGGTFAAGEAALKLGHPLFVLDYHGLTPSAKGNKVLIERGGNPLPFDDHGELDLSGIYDILYTKRDADAPMVQGRLPFEN